MRPYTEGRLDRYRIGIPMYYIVYCAESSGLSGLYTTEHVDAIVTDNNDRQCKTILLENITLINTNYKPVYCNCFKVD